MIRRAVDISGLFSLPYLVGLITVQTGIGHVPVIALSAVFVAVLIVTGNARVSKRNLPHYSILLVFMMVASYGHFTATLTVIVGMLANVLIYEYYSRRAMSRRQAKILLYAIMLSVVGCALVTSRFDRAFIANRNGVPVLLVFMLFMADSYLQGDCATQITVLGFVMVWQYLCKSRAGYLAVGSYLLLRSFRTKRAQVIVFLSISVCLVLVYITGTITLPDITLGGRSIGYLAGRDELWAVSREIIVRNPLGVGYRGYSDIYKSVLGTTFSTHNLYLNILMQYGWFYTGAYAVFLVALVKESSSPVTLAAVFSMYLRGFFEISIPFGLSLGSAMLLLPFYMERPLKSRGQNRRYGDD